MADEKKPTTWEDAAPWLLIAVGAFWLMSRSKEEEKPAAPPPATPPTP